MSSSDPFGDDDDFLNDPSNLAIFEAAEAEAISRSTQAPPALPVASQAVQPQRKKTSYHHEVAPPRSQPRAGPPRLSTAALSKIREPAPLNTEPRTANSGFGWEHNGKRSIDGNLERHVQAVKDRQGYWNHDNLTNGPSAFDGIAASQNPRRGRTIVESENDELVPHEFVVDSDGKYVFAPNTGPVQAQESLTEGKERVESAAAARREAIVGKLANNQNPPIAPRPPLSRSNSSSSTSSLRPPPLEARGSTSTSPFLMNNPPLLPQPGAKLNSNRTLARSASMGSHILSRPSAPAAGPSRHFSHLPTIPSQSSETSSQRLPETLHPGFQVPAFHLGSQGIAPPPSQGSLARRSVLELEEERKKRVAVEEELARLKMELEKSRATSHTGDEKRDEGDQTPVFTEEERKKLQDEVWRARGEAEIVRKAQKAELSRFAEREAKFKKQLAEMEATAKLKEEEGRRQLETIRSQAVFSNHMTHSTIKNRNLQSSQRPTHGASSQARGAPTPGRFMGNGSPSRRESLGPDMMTPAPLGQNSKFRVKQPQFGLFNNAFATTPTILNGRAKRSRSDVPDQMRSPSASPIKVINGNRTPTKGLSPTTSRISSPLNVRSPQASPTKSRIGSPLVEKEDVIGVDEESMGWQPDFGNGADVSNDVGEDIEVEENDQKADLLHHLFNHIDLHSLSISNLDSAPANLEDLREISSQPAIYAIINYPLNLQQPPDQALRYAKNCSNLLKACGDATIEFEALLQIVSESLHNLLILVAGAQGAPILLAELSCIMNILSLLSTMVFLFPTSSRILEILSLPSPALINHISRRIFSHEGDFKKLSETVSKGDSTGKAINGSEGWAEVLASTLVDLAEGFCWFIGDGRKMWSEDILVDTILNLTLPHLSFSINSRAVDLFFRAACSADNFRALVSASEKYPSPAESPPLVEAMCRLLLSPPHIAASNEKLNFQIKIIESFCMLVIADPDAVTIVAEKSILVPTLILILEKESMKIWGVHGLLYSIKNALSLLVPTLSLLHHLIFPSSLTTQTTQTLRISISQTEDSPPGINLARRLHAVTGSGKEFNGLPHVFVSALGRMAYAEPEITSGGGGDDGWGGELEEGVSTSDLRTIQFLSQDLLEAVVEGPEGDNIYEIYVEDEDSPDGPTTANQSQKISVQEEIQNSKEVEGDIDMEVYAAMGVIGDEEDIL